MFVKVIYNHPEHIRLVLMITSCVGVNRIYTIETQEQKYLRYSLKT